MTPDAAGKDHFVIVDAVRIVEHPKIDAESLERNPSLPFTRLLEQVALGARDEDSLASLVGRLARLRRKLTGRDEYDIAAASGGLTLPQISNRLLDALDPDKIIEAARGGAGLAPAQEPTAEQIAEAARQLAEEAARLFDSPELRQTLIAIHERAEQTIDQVSEDKVTKAGFGEGATAQALHTIESFRQFIQEHRDEITALEIILSQPYGQQRLTFDQIKELAERLQMPPHAWTTEGLWRAYAQLERDRVRGLRAKRVLTDLVSLVRHAVQPDDDLVPYPDLVRQRYEQWLAAQEASGRAFTPEQRWWLDEIAEHVGVSLDITPADLDVGEFFNRGGRLGATRVFGAEWMKLVDELNAVLVD